jgi:hypothetical protein
MLEVSNAKAGFSSIRPRPRLLADLSGMNSHAAEIVGRRTPRVARQSDASRIRAGGHATVASGPANTASSRACTFASREADGRGEGRGIVVSRLGYDGFFQIGGPVEDAGRLNYYRRLHRLVVDSARHARRPVPQPAALSARDPPDAAHPPVHAGRHRRERSRNLRHARWHHAAHARQVFIIPAHGLHSFSTHESPMRVIAITRTAISGRRTRTIR